MLNLLQPSHARLALIVSLLIALMGIARAEPVTLRMAAIAPDGTAWARELRAFGREVDAETHGELRIKWYLGGIAGDELTAVERARHNQLDGITGAIFCERLAPSLRVLQLVGLFETRDEVNYVLGRLKPMLDVEFRKSGFNNLADSVFGARVLFSRQPVRSLSEFRQRRWWIWNLDDVVQLTVPNLGAQVAAAPLEQAGSLYERGGSDGFITLPSAALAYQWSSVVRYLTELTLSMVPACVVVSNRAMDSLSLEQQQALISASARLRVRFNDVSATLDQSLLGGLFEKQGIKKVPISPQFRSEYRAAAKETRQRLSQELGMQALLNQVESMLNEYRATTANKH